MVFWIYHGQMEPSFIFPQPIIHSGICRSFFSRRFKSTEVWGTIDYFSKCTVPVIYSCFYTSSEFKTIFSFTSHNCMWSKRIIERIMLDKISGLTVACMPIEFVASFYVSPLRVPLVSIFYFLILPIFWRKKNTHHFHICLYLQNWNTR